MVEENIYLGKKFKEMSVKELEHVRNKWLAYNKTGVELWTKECEKYYKTRIK